jgi:hypothetical protein
MLKPERYPWQAQANAGQSLGTAQPRVCNENETDERSSEGAKVHYALCNCRLTFYRASNCMEHFWTQTIMQMIHELKVVNIVSVFPQHLKKHSTNTGEHSTGPRAVRELSGRNGAGEGRPDDPGTRAAGPAGGAARAHLYRAQEVDDRQRARDNPVRVLLQLCRRQAGLAAGYSAR